MVTRLSDFLNTSFSTLSANDTNNTGVTYPGTVAHGTTLTPGVGIGAGLQYRVETSNNNDEIGMLLETVTTDVTPGSEDFDFVVKLMQAGATASEKFRVSSTGNVLVNRTTSTVGLNTRLDVAGAVNAEAFYVNGQAIATTALANVGNVSPTGNTQGRLWWNSDLGELLVYYIDEDGTQQWTVATPSKTGIQGVQGNQGIQGVQGIQGFQGLQGTNGFQGTQGTNGFQGIQGTTGFQGLQGNNGFQGIQGIQSIQGVQGATGAGGGGDTSFPFKRANIAFARAMTA